MTTQLLRRELGPVLPPLLDESVTDVTITADGEIQLDTLTGQTTLPQTLAPAKTTSLIALIAGLEDQVAHEERPILECMVDLDGLRVRVEALLPPVSPGPILCFRRPATQVWSLEDLVERETLTADAAELLTDAVHDRKTIVIAGSTGSGKTTMASAILGAAHPQRLVVCEEGLRELRLPSDARADRLVTAPDAGVTMTTLIRAALRLNPDRIVVGELRGPEALDMLRAAITGHPGLATLHAASPTETLTRLLDLSSEAGVALTLHRVEQAVDLVVYMARRGHRRELAAVYAPQPDTPPTPTEAPGRLLYSARRLHTAAILGILGVFGPRAAVASTGGGNLPWNSILNTLADNLSGPTASALIILAILAAIAAWMFIDETRLLHRIVKVVIAAGMIAAVASGTLMSAFGISGATI